MKNVRVILKDEVFGEMEKLTSTLKISKDKYINEAINFYNLLNKRRLLKQQLQKESLEGAADSMAVLAEFEKLEDEFNR